MQRCSWVNLNNEKYVQYHDQEWGIPSTDDYYLFEMLVLEMFQAGLSWETILNKRENFRQAFSNFDPQKVSNYDENKINQLMHNKAIIRNKLKIEASINNARIFLNLKKEYGTFANYIWHFTDYKSIINERGIMLDCNDLSDKISADLKKRGMKFLGTKIIYSYLQAIGIIDDHELNCYKRR